MELVSGNCQIVGHPGHSSQSRNWPRAPIKFMELVPRIGKSLDATGCISMLLPVLQIEPKPTLQSVLLACFMTFRKFLTDHMSLVVRYVQDEKTEAARQPFVDLFQLHGKSAGVTQIFAKLQDGHKPEK